MLPLLPLPVGELFAEGDFFEFADGAARDGVEEQSLLFTSGGGRILRRKRCWNRDNSCE